MIPIKSQVLFKHGTRGRKVRENDHRRSLGILDYGRLYYGKGLYHPFMFLKMNRESLVKMSG